VSLSPPPGVRAARIGKLFRIDPASGATTAVDVEALPKNDGLLRDGKRLYVVQNRLNPLAKLELSPDGPAARLVQQRTDTRDNAVAIDKF